MQSEPEKQDKNQISEKKIWNLSDFELKFSHCVRFWFEVFLELGIAQHRDFVGV